MWKGLNLHDEIIFYCQAQTMNIEGHTFKAEFDFLVVNQVGIVWNKGYLHFSLRTFYYGLTFFYCVHYTFSIKTCLKNLKTKKHLYRRPGCI